MINIESVLLSRGIQLGEKNRSDYLILCPFHDDKSASCSVNKEKGFFHCWSCGEKGSIAKLVGRLDGIDEKEAWKILNGTETGGKVFHVKKEERIEKWVPDPLVEKYYEVKSLLELLVSRKDLRLGKLLNKELKGEETWNKFRERQKQLKEEWDTEIYHLEAKFNYITDYVESYHKDKLYFEFVKLVKEYKFNKEFQLVLELLENQKYQDYKKEKQILKELHFSAYQKIKGKLEEKIDEIFQ